MAFAYRGGADIPLECYSGEHICHPNPSSYPHFGSIYDTHIARSRYAGKDATEFWTDMHGHLQDEILEAIDSGDPGELVSSQATCRRASDFMVLV